jgi:preprotein translocase subunit SecD
MGLRVPQALACAAIVTLAAPATAFAADACPVIEVAAVAPNHATTRVVGDQNGKQVSLAPPLAVLADVTSAAASRADGADGVGFNVRPAAGARLRAYTAAHVGSQLAFVVDGRARVVTIRDPIAGDAFWISPMEQGAARMLAGRVNNCVTP